VDETEKVDIGFDAAQGKPQVKAPSEKEMSEFLAGSPLPKDKKIYLRMCVWWAVNDVWRWIPNLKTAFSKEQVKNLKALVALLDESEPGERIFKAEIARELDRFDECLLLLSYQFEEGYEYVVGFIRKLAEEKEWAAKPFESAK
jgi:hypothetical protein